MPRSSRNSRASRFVVPSAGHGRRFRWHRRRGVRRPGRGRPQPIEGGEKPLGEFHFFTPLGRRKVKRLESLQNVCFECAADVGVDKIVLDAAQTSGNLVEDDALLVEAIGVFFRQEPQQIANQLPIVGNRFTRFKHVRPEPRSAS